MTSIQQEIQLREQALALLRIEWEQMLEQVSFGSEDKKRPAARQGKMNKSETRRSISSGRYDTNR
jgi:hypothetical protein